jgi:hypothetical protein
LLSLKLYHEHCVAEPLLSFIEYRFTYKVEDLLPAPSCAVDLPMLMPMVEIRIVLLWPILILSYETCMKF